MTEWDGRRRLNQRIYDQLSESERETLVVSEETPQTTGHPATEPEYQEEEHASSDV